MAFAIKCTTNWIYFAAEVVCLLCQAAVILPYLSYLAVDSPERKRKEALIFSKTGKKKEAYRAYEELLFTNYQFISLVLKDLRILYLKDEEHAMAWKLVDVQKQAARVFEMGKYYEVSTGLDVASWEKDVPKTAEIMRQILGRLWTILGISLNRACIST